MARSAQHAFNAADVADAVFSTMVLRREESVPAYTAQHDVEAMQTAIASIDDGLKAAGLSFAEYLERIRHGREIHASRAGQRWRFSARERAVQRIDSAVAHLCQLMQPPSH